MTTPEPEELLGIAVDVARACAELVRERGARVRRVADTKTSETDVVTETDRASEVLARRILAERRPDDAVLGEEGDDVPGTTGVRWIVDPIDGTVNFLYGLHEYAVTVAAEVDGELVAGIVLDVRHQLEYTAFVDAGGTVRSARNGDPITVRPSGPLVSRLCGTGFSYVPEVRERQAHAWARLMPQVRDLRRHGSAALEICHVAEGAMDAYFEEGVHLWDYGAGALVARGAGARFEVLTGASGLCFVLCAPEKGFDELRAAVLAVGFTAPETV